MTKFNGQSAIIIKNFRQDEKGDLDFSITQTNGFDAVYALLTSALMLSQRMGLSEGEGVDALNSVLEDIREAHPKLTKKEV
ncbi:MAG: hypothetical protein DUD35_05570 [Lactobacillus sp.]|jgi:hypothetical protein|nr:MAG: hypothetical protein DUD35_05570 [Lactobacillus sp.]